MKSDRNKNIILIVLIVVLVSMTIAYAALQTQLKIGNNDTTATVHGGTWDVHFLANSVSTSTSGTGYSLTTPSVSGSSISNVRVRFSDTDDSVTYTFVLQNAGSINAKLSAISPSTLTPSCTGLDSTSNSIVCNNLSYTLSYYGSPTKISDGSIGTSTLSGNLAVNQVLKAGEQISVQLTVSYTGQDLPTDDVMISGLDRTLTFTQE